MVKSRNCHACRACHYVFDFALGCQYAKRVVFDDNRIFGSLAGTILLHLIFELLGDKELLDATKDAIKQFLISKFKSIAAFFGGAK